MKSYNSRKDKFLQVLIEPWQLEEIRRLAYERRTSMSKIMRQILEKELSFLKKIENLKKETS